MATQDEDMKVRQRWRDISQEEYTRLLGDYSTVGRLYHHLALLERFPA